MALSQQLLKSIEDLKVAPSVRRELVSTAKVAMAFLELAAPYDDTPPRSESNPGGRDPNKPHYRDNLKLEVETTDRVVVRIVADVPHAMGVEANQGLLKKALKATR